jgi:hypothetical protein
MDSELMLHVVMGMYMDRDTMARFEQMSVGDESGEETWSGGPYYENGRTVWYA